MIDKKALQDFVEDQLKDSGCFLTDLTISKDNNIVVEIDSMGSVDIEQCVNLTRAIEGKFDRDVEDYELEVGSAGLTSPFKVRAQYEKNVGNNVECLTVDGEKYHGVLETVGDKDFVINVERKVKKEGSKKPVLEQIGITIPYEKVKSIKYDLKI